MKTIRRAAHYGLAAPYWVGHNLHNAWGIVNVFDIAWVRRLPGGLLPEDHPFVSGGENDGTWLANIVYRSPRRLRCPDSDEEIVTKVMKHLRNMVRSSASNKATRMPPAVNYIHGCVHFNGVSLVFDDFADAVSHFTDPTFKSEFKRMIAAEKREPTIIFRERDYDSDEFALFSCFMKSIFPYFGNPNGPKKRIHWGTPSPYAAFNLITGNWIRDTRMVMTAEGRSRVPRLPVAESYFSGGPYENGWSDYLAPEKALTAFTTWRVRARGARGGMYFTDKRKVDRGFRYDPRRLITLSERMKEKLRERVTGVEPWNTATEAGRRSSDAERHVH